MFFVRHRTMPGGPTAYFLVENVQRPTGPAQVIHARFDHPPTPKEVRKAEDEAKAASANDRNRVR